MKKYQVTFVATYEATIEIAAPDRDKAMERAEYLLNAEGEIYPEHMTHNGTKSDMTDLMIDGFEERNIEMGYYTTYSLTLEEGPREQFKKMLEDIDAMMGENEMSSFESINAKWYSYETDIKQLSLKYPDIIFRVNGDGEDSDDLWQDFWHAGKCFSEKVHFASLSEIRDIIA